MIERFNRTLTTMLSHYVCKSQKDWDEALPYVLLAYRSSIHETTGFTPNLLFLGREVILPLDLIYGDPDVQNKLVQSEYARGDRRTF